MNWNVRGIILSTYRCRKFTSSRNTCYHWLLWICTEVMSCKSTCQRDHVKFYLDDLKTGRSLRIKILPIDQPNDWQLTPRSDIHPSYFIRLGYNYIYSRSNTLRLLSWTPHLKITMTTLFAWPNFKCFLCSTSVKQAHAISRVIIKGFSTVEPDDGCKDQGHAQYRWPLIQVRLYMLSLVFNTFKMVAYIVYNHPC